MSVGLVERAFELAGSGTCHNMQELGSRLRAEGYVQVSSHLDAISLRRQLKGLIVEARRRQMHVVGATEA